MILCESETGATELKRAYSFYPGKVKVLPIFAGDVIHSTGNEEKGLEILEGCGLAKNKFFLYPAQFWPHKNHYNLLVAFKEFLSDNSSNELKLVLCGSNLGNLKYIQQAIASMGLQDSVVIAGFLATDRLHHLYKNALAMVMPTFLGPTNLPLIEAAHLGCPVLCSDLEGHRELLAENAIYFNPADTASIRSAMKQIMPQEYRTSLIHGAKLHIASSPFNIENTLSELDKILLEAMVIRRTWGKNYPE
jgi:glycosyltransferase involved in cell wall biosynthesis